MNVHQFARTMRERLLANRHKDQVDVARSAGEEPVLQDQGPGWRRMTPEAMMRLVEQAVRDLRDAFIEGKGGQRSSPAQHPADEHMAFVVEKAADLANLAMMCADKAAGDRDNAYLREHLSLAEQLGAVALALVPEIWVCEGCNRADAFDQWGPWHACRHCSCLNFRQTDGSGLRYQVPPPKPEGTK